MTIIARHAQRRHCVWCLALLAAGGVACGGGSSMTGTGGGSGSAGVSGGAGSSGNAGTTGNAGTSGGAGTSGNAGVSGGAGTSGNAGTSGGAATSGNAGASGNAGSGGGAAGASGGGAGTAAARGGAGGRGGATAGAGGATAGSGGSTVGRGGASGGTAGAGGVGGGAMPSAGCTSATGTAASGHYMIDVSGTQREYIIKIPAGYDRSHPYRLVLAFHGAMYDAASVDSGGAPSPSGPYFGVEPLAGGSTIFVAGQALSDKWGDQSGRDTAYFNAMVTRFKSELCIDQSRIFAMGFSAGSIFTISLGCAEAEQLRAIAPMSGSIRTCTGTTPIAYWGSHGTNDPTINISNGRMVRDNFRNRNHCTTTTAPDTQAGCVNYQGCDPGKPVSWCEFDGVHQPPPYSGEAIWRFFSQF